MGKVPFITDNYRNNIPVNWYPAKDDERGVILWGTPGLELKLTLPGLPIRGLHVVGSYLYAVAGHGFYRVASNWGYEDLGGVPGDGPVSITDNGIEILIVAPGYAATLCTLSSGALSTPATGFFLSSATFQDGYFIASENGTGKFYISGLYDGSTWGALDYAVPEGDADNLVALLSDHRELWLFGGVSTEVWYNSGDTFPFVHNQGGFIEQGCAAVKSPAQFDNSVVWLSHLGQVIRANGYTPQIISTRKLEREWQGYSTISDAEGFAYVWEGHWFYHLVFPTARKVYVFDAATNLWHERRSYPETDGRHRARCYALFGRDHIVGDYSLGNLYEMRSDVYLDNSETIARTLETHTVSADGKLLRFPGLQIQFDAGYADQEGQGSDPQAMLQWSDDGGRNWSHEHWASIGKVGEYGRRAMWWRLAASRDRVFRLVVTDPALATITSWNLMQPGVGR